MPYKLPDGFTWYDINIHDKKDITAVIIILK